MIIRKLVQRFHLIVNEKAKKPIKTKLPKIKNIREPLLSLDSFEITSISGSVGKAFKRPSDSFVTVIDSIYFSRRTLWRNCRFFAFRYLPLLKVPIKIKYFV